MLPGLYILGEKTHLVRGEMNRCIALQASKQQGLITYTAFLCVSLRWYPIVID